MKESNWDDCLANYAAKRVTPDVLRAESLIETAKERIAQVGQITEKNGNFVFEDYYTSLVELLQAKTFTAGYNVLNHICLGFYLRDHLKRADLFLIFDDVRYKRNSLTYYGKRMDFPTAKHAINRCKKIMSEL